MDNKRLDFRQVWIADNYCKHQFAVEFERNKPAQYDFGLTNRVESKQFITDLVSDVP